MIYNLKMLCSIGFLFIAFLTSAQDHRVDSLNVLIQNYDALNAGKSFTLNDSIKVKYYERLSDYLYDSNRDASLQYSKKAADLALKIKYFKGVYTNNYNLGTAYSISGDYLLSLTYLNQAAIASEHLKSGSKTANVYNEKGIVYSKMSNYAEAVRYAFLALRYYEKSNDHQLYGNSLVNLGILYKHQNKIELAVNQYEKAIKSYKKLEGENAVFSIAATYNNLAQAYLKAGKTTKSINALNESQNYAQKISDQYLNAENNYALGLIYFNLGQYSQSLFNFQNGLQSFENLNDKSGIAKSKVALGRNFLKLKQFKNALKYNSEGLELAKKIKHLEWQKEGYRDRAQIFDEAGDFKAAYQNHVYYKMVNDSMFNANQEKKITEMQMQYAFDKTQEKSRTVQMQKILKLNNEASRLHFIKNSALLAAGVFLLLFGAVLYNFLKVKNQRKLIAIQQNELQIQNHQIQTALFEKEVLLKEIHHRVKNNLQIISSLLNIQAQNITDTKVLDSIKEGQSRVQAMSLIHQNLYQSQKLDAIDMAEYIKQLTRYLNTIFNTDAKTINFNIAIQNIFFDIDTAIPLGLIVNELISNAFKYAFVAQPNPKIDISIISIDAMDYILRISDNGIGISDNFKIENANSLGLKLVSILSRQLRGSVDYTSNNGTVFEVKFKHIKNFNAI